MKTFISIVITSLCLFIGTAFADKPDWAIKDKHSKDAMEMRKDKHSRDIDNDDNRGMMRKDMHDKKRMENIVHDNDNVNSDKQGKHDEVMERVREKKLSSKQKELDNISDSAKENRKKWWKFWE